MALTASSTRLAIVLQDPREADRGAQTRSNQTEAAAFAQSSFRLTNRLTLSLGGRLTFASSSRSFSDQTELQRFDPHREELRFAGTLGFNWQMADDLSAFYRFQQGYRPGGLGLSLTDRGIGLRQFVSDDLRMHDLGVRWGTRSRSSIWGQATVFTADWRNIQADLVAQFGAPYTANIGRGIIRGLDIEVNWKPLPTLTIGLAAFLNRSHLAEVAPNFSATNPGYDALGAALPNVARNGTRSFASWRREVGQGIVLAVEGTARYVGESRLGVGPLLDLPQGKYFTADLAARLEKGGWTLLLSVLNAGDAEGNTFSYGNPFGLTKGQQITPLRPRTVRLGLQRRF
jgi:outer membrane receptor protein involved in Fe transport